MKISIITVCYNSALTIRDTIESVLNQTYNDVEYIIIDGNSSDGTKEIISEYKNKIQIQISEPDNGMYDAINKGIKLSSGEIIGILNSDDIYCKPDILDIVAKQFATNNVDSIFGDVRFVKEDNPERTVRYISSRKFRPYMLRFGFMPTHPTFFAKRDLFEKIGYYKTDYRIAADYELMIRFIYLKKISYRYIPKDMVKMRIGGKSTKSIMSNYIINKEIKRACLENGIYTNSIILAFRYLIKVFELINLKN